MQAAQPVQAPPTVRLATRADIPALAAVLSSAFARDPFMNYLAGGRSERSLRMREAWRGILRHASAGMAGTWTTTDRDGAAIWIPPDRRASTLLDSIRLMPSMARLTSWSRMREIGDAMDTLGRRRRAHVPGPHWYLSALGVAPERQRRGIGSALMQPALDLADEVGVPAYLETATAHNVLLYERHGFEVVEELILPKTDIRGWLMRRRPAAPR